MLDDWEVSGITQFQSGFPIRLNTEDDNELINSLFFLGTEAPSLNGPLQILNPKKNGRLLPQLQSVLQIRRSGSSTTARNARSAAARD